MNGSVIAICLSELFINKASFNLQDKFNKDLYQCIICYQGTWHRISYVGDFPDYFTVKLLWERSCHILHDAQLIVPINYLSEIYSVLLEVPEGASSHSGIPAAQRGEFTSFSCMPEQNEHS